MNNIAVFMISSMFFIEGIRILIKNIVLVYKSMSAKNWPTTMGNIQSLSLLSEEIGSNVRITIHEVKVTYNYFIHGEMYIGSQIAFGYYGRDDYRDIKPV